MSSVVNVAAYKFVELDALAPLRNALSELCRQHRLKGTILLSCEGVNLCVAGHSEGIDALLRRMQQIPAVGILDVKRSISNAQPFNRMLVKIKREIIAFGVEGVDPREYTSKRIAPVELKRWLDEGRRVTLLDTRNDIEVQAGTFDKAIAIGVDNFRDFPTAARKLPEELKYQPVVTFCTGGIRCEKAAPLLEREGFREVYQLDGGILKYFEECGGEHYSGECFVFDKRVAVDSALAESNLQMCYACQAILSPEEQRSSQYVEGISCPHCYRPPDESLAKLLKVRNNAIRAAASPLPGSQPYDSVRPIRVPQLHDGRELLEFFAAIHTQYSREQWLEVCRDGQLLCEGQAIGPGFRVRSGSRLEHHLPATREPDVNAAIDVLHEDDALVVVNKPAPLPMHACGRFNRNTLGYILGQVYQPNRLRPAHRLDADTTGVVVLCKTRQIARAVQGEFAAGEVRKRYVARVQGRPHADSFSCELPIGDTPGPGGVRLPDVQGLPATTRFEVLRIFDDGTTLLQVEPLTGRTNQIRAHLWAMGLPIFGDATYLPDGRLGEAKTRAVSDPPLCLHAESIALTHPTEKTSVSFAADLPNWATATSVASHVAQTIDL